MPGRHTASSANEPQDKGFNYYYYSPNLNKNSTPSIILNSSVVSSCITDCGVSITAVSCGIIDRRISATALLDSSQSEKLILVHAVHLLAQVNNLKITYCSHYNLEIFIFINQTAKYS